ncbi:hypothetical protein ACJ65_01030 [Kocuria rhizophila]|nr:hypothetical protein ACJ65_01030 [Kocuria rhizophila]
MCRNWNRSSGQAITKAVPTMSSSLTNWVPVSMWKRESAEALRWSPITKTLPSGTVTSKAKSEGAAPG